MWKRATTVVLACTLVPWSSAGVNTAPFQAPRGAAVVSGAEREKRSWGVLMGGLEDVKPMRRMHALSALAAIGPTPRVVQLLEWALDDPDAAVRQAAASTLGELRSRSSVAKLRKALEDDRHPEVIFTVARALWEIGDRGGREIFHEVLAGERSDTHEGISGAMHEARRKLRDRNAASWALMGVKEAAGYVLGPLSLGFALAEEMTKDGTASARALSATILAADPDPSSLHALESALVDKNWIVRIAAAKSLARRGSTTSVPKLEPLLADEKEAVRYTAAAAILKLTGKRG